MADRFESWSQNGEDVVLWRALRDVEHGMYVEVGANHPTWLSMTKAFYDLGWRGITIEPMHALAELHRTERPADDLIEAAVTSRAPERVLLHQIEDTGLSTLEDDVSRRHAGEGWTVHDVDVATVRLDDVLAAHDCDHRELHFMTVDVEGAELDVLSTLDLRRFRPWVLVVEATAPLDATPTYQSWEPQVLEADYEFCLFDGLSRFYVAAEHADRLRDRLSYGACVFDNYRGHLERGLQSELESTRTDLSRITDDAIRWRTAALVQWSETVVRASSTEGQALQAQVDHLHAEIKALHETVSWRVTAPLRAVRSRGH